MDHPVILNIVIIGILVLIAGAIIWYMIRAKRRGAKCIGCPYGSSCAGKCGGSQTPKK